MSRDLILALDPGSITTGYALLRLDGSLHEPGVLKATKKEWPFIERVKGITRDLSVFNTGPFNIAHVVIEIGTKQHRRNPGVNLAVYAFAVGAIWATCRRAFPGATVDTVEANAWTRGTSKPERIAELAAIEPKYDPEQDKGGDAADAIGVGRYWIGERKTRTAK